AFSGTSLFGQDRAGCCRPPSRPTRPDRVPCRKERAYLCGPCRADATAHFQHLPLSIATLIIRGSHMPIYEFLCSQCHRRFRKLVGVVAQPTPLQCPRCQSTDLNRQMSRFARVRNEDEALDSLADEMEAMGDTEDPKAIRRLMREMGSELGEDFDEDFEQM